MPPDQRVRFISYLNPNLALGRDGAKTVIRNLNESGLVWIRRDRGPGAFSLLHETDNYGLFWSGKGDPLGLCPFNPDDREHICTADLLGAERYPWFALNNHDHSHVADVDHGNTTSGTNVIAWTWYSTARPEENQVWRMENV